MEDQQEDQIALKNRLAGIGAEVGGGVATDYFSSGLLAFGPLGWLGYGAINFGQGAYTNYLVQKHIYGEENIKWGEVWASGGMGMIPFSQIPVGAKAAKYLGAEGTVKRGLVGGASIGLAGEQLRVGIDEKKLLSPLEATLAAGLGGGFAGGLQALQPKGAILGPNISAWKTNRAFKQGQKEAAKVKLPTDIPDLEVRPQPPISGGLEEQIPSALKLKLMASGVNSPSDEPLEHWTNIFGKRLGKAIKKAIDETKQGIQLTLGRESDNIKVKPGFDLFALNPESKEAKRLLLNGFAEKNGYKNWADFKKKVVNVYPYQEELLYKYLKENPGVGQVEHKIAKASKISRYNILKETFPDMDEAEIMARLAIKSRNTFDMDWFWFKRYIGRDGKWYNNGLNRGDRHSLLNTIPDWNTRMIRLKNIVEQIGYGGEGKKGYVLANMTGRQVERFGREPGILWQALDPGNRLIVSVKIKNPKASLQKQMGRLGNITIQRAKDGLIIGEIGEYMDALYPADVRAKQALEIALNRIGIRGRRAIAQWRKEQILKRLETIIRDAPKLPKTPKLRQQAILKGLQDDMDELFAEFDFLTPQFYGEIIEDMRGYPDMIDTFDTGYI